MTERDYLKKYDIRIVIPSRGRWNSMMTTKLLPEWVEVVVPDNEIEQYSKAIPNPLIPIPHELEGMGQVRNWIIDNLPNEIIFMIDDDITKFYCMTEYHARNIDDPEELVQIIINECVMAKDAGVHVFGISQTDIRKYNGCNPFSLCTWVSAVIGVIGKRTHNRDDKFKVDIDFCLQNLLVDRIIWCDNRYYALQYRDNNKGGNALYRDEEAFEKSTQSLKDKWGDYIKLGKHKNQIHIALNVKRKQDIKYD